MGINRILKKLGQNCSCCVKKYPYCSCAIVFLCVLYLFSPLMFTLFAYCSPVFGFGFLVYRMFIGTRRQNVINVGSGSKTRKGFQCRRSFRTVYCVRVPERRNESSLLQDTPGARQNARETSNVIFNNMNAEGKTDKLVDNRTSVEEHPKDEKYRKCSLDDHNVKVQEKLDDDEKSLMDLGVSEVERAKRLESLMERRRSRTLSKFNIIRNAMGIGVGSNSCGQISSLHIPKKNPFLFKDSGDLPGSAPTYMIKNNPFDLPYDTHEEKPILTGDGFEDEFMAAHKKEPLLGDFAPPESTNDKLEYFDAEFAVKQLRRLGTSKAANKEDDNKRPQVKRLIPDIVTNANRAIEEGESSEKVVNLVDHTKEHEVDHTKEHELDHDVVSSDQSTPSSYSSEDEPILRPNREAILHCLSMSRMRVISQGSSSLHRNAESFDCGPSALFDKSKTDSFFFGANKRVHYGSTNSFASDMQVEVSGSPMSTNISSLDEEGKGSLVNSTNPSELDLNELRFRDIDEASEQDATEPDGSLIQTVVNQP